MSEQLLLSLGIVEHDFRYNITVLSDRYFRTWYPGLGILSLQDGDDLICTINGCNLFITSYSYDPDKSSDDKSADYGLILIIEKVNNEFIFRKINYYEKNIRASICPYSMWAYMMDIIDYEAHPIFKERNIINLGYPHHIITPIFPRDDEPSFFTCGYLKQLSLPDVKIGYRLLPSGNGITYENQIDGPKKKFTCNRIKDETKLYHYINTDKETNIDGEKNFVKINDLHITKLYSGQQMILYDKVELERRLAGIQNFVNGRRDNIIEEEPICVREITNVVATLLPSVESWNWPTYNNFLKIYYYVQGKRYFNQWINAECFSKVADDDHRQYDRVYSKSARISIVRGEKISSYNSFQNIYGIYTCTVSKEISTYKSPLVEIGNTYIIPSNGTKIRLREIEVNENQSNGANCIEFYDTWAIVTSVEIKSERNYEFVTIHDFIKIRDRVKIENNKAILNDNIIFGRYIIVKCKYETIVNTTFFTEQIFEYSKAKVPEKDDETIPGDDEDIIDEDEPELFEAPMEFMEDDATSSTTTHKSITKEFKIITEPIGNRSPPQRKSENQKNKEFLLIIILAGFIVLAIIILIITGFGMLRKRRKVGQKMMSKSISTSISDSSTKFTGINHKEKKITQSSKKIIQPSYSKVKLNEGPNIVLVAK
uniref:Ig-like domain-containing protein n=1 Tax=Parastrongyloides trichosuri TaxID=131310 RepID=A0A0N4Z0D2_PARTI